MAEVQQTGSCCMYTRFNKSYCLDTSEFLSCLWTGVKPALERVCHPWPTNTLWERVFLVFSIFRPAVHSRQVHMEKLFTRFPADQICHTVAMTGVCVRIRSYCFLLLENKLSLLGDDPCRTSTKSLECCSVTYANVIHFYPQPFVQIWPQ